MVVQSSIQVQQDTCGRACSWSYVSVTWHDVTLCHGISGSPVLPGTTRHYPVLPGTTGKLISEQSPGSQAISSYL
eukprot:1374620-Amorphochlora_amoeboformis.AAC.1